MMNHQLNVYQRVNRDGLLSLAAELDLKADHHDLVVEIWEANPDKWTDEIREAVKSSYYAAEGYKEIAALARKRAQALPEDPEDACS